MVERIAAKFRLLKPVQSGRSGHRRQRNPARSNRVESRASARLQTCHDVQSGEGCEMDAEGRYSRDLSDRDQAAPERPLRPPGRSHEWRRAKGRRLATTLRRKIDITTRSIPEAFSCELKRAQRAERC